MGGAKRFRYSFSPTKFYDCPLQNLHKNEGACVVEGMNRGGIYTKGPYLTLKQRAGEKLGNEFIAVVMALWGQR